MPRLSAAWVKLPHFRYRYENEDGFEILHFRASVLFTTERTVSSFPRCLSYLRDTVSSEYGDPPIGE